MMLSGPDANAVDSLFSKALDLISNFSGNATNALNSGIALLDKVRNASQAADQFALYGLFPLCLTLLILAENGRALTEGSPFRVPYVLGRAGIVAGLVLIYPDLCGLITKVAGGGGGWMSQASYFDLSDLDRSGEALGQAWDSSNISSFIVIVLVWMAVMVAALFAYVAGMLLSLSQAALITLLLALGKTCIVLSLVPGITVGKGWARSLAQVAAWSTVAGVITALLASGNDSIRDLMRSGQTVPMLKLSAHFIILAICTLSVPVITARIFSGAAPHAVGAMGAMIAGFGLARLSVAQVRNRSFKQGTQQKGDGFDEGMGPGGRRVVERLPPPEPFHKAHHASLAPTRVTAAQSAPAKPDQSVGNKRIFAGAEGGRLRVARAPLPQAPEDAPTGRFVRPQPEACTETL